MNIEDYETRPKVRLSYRTRGECNHLLMTQQTEAPNVNFRKISQSEDDLRSRIFGTFVAKFLACLPAVGFSNT